MRIGLLSFEYPPETGFGGIGTYTYYQARALARLGHEVHVLAGLKETSALYTEQHDGVLVHRYRPDGPVMAAFDGLGKWKWWWTRQRLENGWSMYHALQVLTEKYHFDVLEMPECGAEGYLINALIRTPTVVRFHSPSRLIMPYYDVEPADVSLCSRLEEFAIRKATALTSCSAFLGREVREKLGIDKPIRVIPNGIDVGLFDQAPVVDVSAKYGFPRGKVTILFAGRMERRKGIHLCAQIVAPLVKKHDVAFVFAGQDLFGYMKDTLLPAVQAPDVRGSVHYIGKLDLDELRSCVRAADIFMLPSLWENCPYSCLEAMAAGRAIVSSDQGGMPELIRDGVNGLLAECGTPESFAQRIELLISDPDLRKKVGENARRTVLEQYTDDRIARLSVEAYGAVSR